MQTNWHALATSISTQKREEEEWETKCSLVKLCCIKVWNCVRVIFFVFVLCYFRKHSSEAASVFLSLSLCSLASFLASWDDCLDEAFQVIKWLKLKHILEDYFHCSSPHVHWIKYFSNCLTFCYQAALLALPVTFVIENLVSKTEEKRGCVGGCTDKHLLRS